MSHGKNHLGEHGCLMLSRSTESLPVGGERFKRVVTFVPLVLTLSVHVCELRICKFVESLVACSIRHVDSTHSFTPHRCFLRTVEVTIFRSPTTATACQLAQQSIETQRCSWVNEDGSWRGSRVAAQKPSDSIVL